MLRVLMNFKRPASGDPAACRNRRHAGDAARRRRCIGTDERGFPVAHRRVGDRAGKGGRRNVMDDIAQRLHLMPPRNPRFWHQGGRTVTDAPRCSPQSGPIAQSTVCCPTRRVYTISSVSSLASRMTDVRTALLFTLTLKPGSAQPLGRTPFGERRLAPIAGGSFEGPKLRGTVMEGGSDWLLLRPDGATQLDVRVGL